MTSLRAGAATDTGMVRSANQDNLHVGTTLFAVADGMGGHRGGEVASEVAIGALTAAFERDHSLAGLVTAVREANRAVFSESQANAQLEGMGTTLTAAALVEEDGEERIAIVNVGDSRTYLLRDGELDQLTQDDSYVADLVRSGQISEQEALTHPRRNIVTKVIGMAGDVEVDPLQLLPATGDRLLLCSDGLTNEVSTNRIAATLRQIADPAEAARELVEQAKANGGADNITVVVVDVVDDGGRAAAASESVEEAPARRGMITAAERNAALRAIDRSDNEDRIGGGWGTPEGDRDDDAALTEPRRRFTLRTALFLVVLLALLGGAAAIVSFGARGSYFVAFDGDRVVIYQGRPGGFLWFQPTEVEATSVSRDQVRPARIDELESGHEVASLERARRYVENLQADETPGATGVTTSTEAPVTTAQQPAAGSATTRAP